MNCQEFDKHIQAFIERDMDYSRLNEFIAHYRSCEDCHEELEINFLMAYVLKDDSQTSFNLSRKLECHIQEELNKKKRFCRYLFWKTFLFVLAEAVAVLSAIYLLMFILS